jgi:hypothetical protein
MRDVLSLPFQPPWRHFHRRSTSIYLFHNYHSILDPTQGACKLYFCETPLKISLSIRTRSLSRPWVQTLGKTLQPVGMEGFHPVITAGHVFTTRIIASVAILSTTGRLYAKGCAWYRAFHSSRSCRVRRLYGSNRHALGHEAWYNLGSYIKKVRALTCIATADHM